MVAAAVAVVVVVVLLPVPGAVAATVDTTDDPLIPALLPGSAHDPKP